MKKQNRFGRGIKKACALGLAGSLLLLSAPLNGYAEQENVVEVSDLASLQEAVAEVTAEDEAAEATAEAAAEDAAASGQANQWQNKRLLVMSEVEFDAMGAEHVIRGYGDLYVLDYATEEETKEAYRKLKKLPGLTAEADYTYAPAAAVKETAAAQETAEEKKTAAEEGAAGKADTAPEETAAGRQEKKGGSICAAVLDTGYDIRTYGTGRITGGTDITGAGTVQDANGHGTAMGNLILDHTPDNITVMPVKVADDSGRTSALKLYMGICYAVENGADIILISMSAYQAKNPETVGAAIQKAYDAGVLTVVSAGNEGQEVSEYSPANVEKAITVSAVNADGAVMGYSNYGAGVDYCSYGRVKVSALGREATEYSGTSVAAAIAAAVISANKALEEDASCEALIRRLDGLAKDLGEPGRDTFYGKGLLSAEGIDPLEEENEASDLPELLTCDWEHISDERLNALIGESDELVIRRFLDRRDEKEREEIGRRAPVLKSAHVEIVCGTDGREQYRNVEPLYQYLYSERFDEYYIQKKISGTYYMYIQNASAKVYLTTNLDEEKCTLHVKFSGTSTNPADNPTITVSGTGAGAYDLSDMKIDGVKTFTDDNGNVNTIGQVGVTGIRLLKPAHSCVTGQQKSEKLKKNHGSDLWSGGFTGFGSNVCADTASKGCKLMVGVGDLELKKENKVQSYCMNVSRYGHSGWSAWSDWSVVQNAFCYQPGSRQHTHTRSCSNCKEIVDTETKAEAILQLSHDFSGAVWNYAENNQVANGERWLQCGYLCGNMPGSSGYDVNGEYWKKDFQYLQRIYFRYMETNGQYPAYTAIADGYYPTGTQMPAIGHTGSENSEFADTPGIGGYAVANQANVMYLDIPRKQYRVGYDGNGADSGTVSAQSVYCGQIFDLQKNGFVRTGYRFLGWSEEPDGAVIESKGKKNLSFTDGDEVVLYAKWERVPIHIALDNMGANRGRGTYNVYECYAEGYYRDRFLTGKFHENRIRIPLKDKEDSSIAGGKRKQQFLGYYTEKNGKGLQVIRKDGKILADIGGAGKYRFFTEDSTIYADWRDMYAVQFDANLPQKDMELLKTGERGERYDTPVTCPYTRWMEEGERATVSFGAAVIENEDYAGFYRFLGWSLKPQIDSRDEIVLSLNKPAYTFTASQDLTLYAQWDTSFLVAYMGNEQSKGIDYTEPAGSSAEDFVFAENGEAAAEHCFAKATKKPAPNRTSGLMENADGTPCMEEVAFSFQGWSMANKKAQQNRREVYLAQQGGVPGLDILLKAKEAGSLTYGELPYRFGACNVPAVHPNVPLGNYTPVVAVYAIWDQYPQIQAADLYVPLADARDGVLTEEYLLSCAKATDEELKSGANPEGVLKHGADASNQTSFTVLDYQAEDFTGAEAEMSLTVTYRAEDKVGNVTTKRVQVYLVDTAAKGCDTGTVRFISERYLDTLAEDSVWRSGAYADTLARVLGNRKTGEEYTAVTPIQRAFGIPSVLKPGSGTWDHVQEVWEFSHDEVLEIQDYVKTVGVGGDPSGFLEKFSGCRIQ